MLSLAQTTSITDKVFHSLLPVIGPQVGRNLEWSQLQPYPHCSESHLSTSPYFLQLEENAHLTKAYPFSLSLALQIFFHIFSRKLMFLQYSIFAYLNKHSIHATLIYLKTNSLCLDSFAANTHVIYLLNIVVKFEPLSQADFCTPNKFHFANILSTLSCQRYFLLCVISV